MVKPHGISWPERRDDAPAPGFPHLPSHLQSSISLGSILSNAIDSTVEDLAYSDLDDRNMYMQWVILISQA